MFCEPQDGSTCPRPVKDHKPHPVGQDPSSFYARSRDEPYFPQAPGSKKQQPGTNLGAYTVGLPRRWTSIHGWLDWLNPQIQRANHTTPF